MITLVIIIFIFIDTPLTRYLFVLGKISTGYFLSNAVSLSFRVISEIIIREITIGNEYRTFTIPSAWRELQSTFYADLQLFVSLFFFFFSTKFLYTDPNAYSRVHVIYCKIISRPCVIISAY